MAKKKAFIVLFGFLFVAIAAADSNRQIFNSWVGRHYTKLGRNIARSVSYDGNSITYDSSWTEDEKVWKAGGMNVFTGQGTGEGDYGWVSTGRKITYERWVTFYFDRNGIITTWRSDGWPVD